MANSLRAAKHGLSGNISSYLVLLQVALPLAACGGYGAADPDKLSPRAGEIVGVLVDDGGKAHPDAWIQLYSTDGTAALISNQGMDSDGRFGIFPPSAGIYNIVGSFGEPGTSTSKAIKQDVSFAAGDSINIGKMEGMKVAVLTVHVATPSGIDPHGVKVEVLGYAASTETIQEGVGAITVGIPAGTYQVRFSKEGLVTQVIEDVLLIGGEAKLLDRVTMELAAKVGFVGPTKGR